MHPRSDSSMWRLVVLVVVLFSAVVNSQDSGWKAAQEADRIDRLPGQPEVDFAIYGGYVTVDEAHGRAHYYIFTEAQEEPEKQPLVIWHTGGPGCSSIAFGFAQELGPFFVNPGGQNLSLNPYSMNKIANVIFVDSPAGAGFSYTNTSSDLLTSGDNRTELYSAGKWPALKLLVAEGIAWGAAYDNYAFVVNWLERFPQYKGRPLFITGESYAGYYVPQLAKLIYENNKNLYNNDKINFKGFMVGNPIIDYYYDRTGYIDYIYYHAMISDDLFYRLKEVCKFSKTNATLSDACTQLFYFETANEYGLIDPYSIYASICLTNGGNTTNVERNAASKQPFNPVLGQFQRGAYDPCTYYYSEAYYNRQDVQKAMHANITGIPYPWIGCNGNLALNWQDSALTVLPIYQELLAAGLRLWVYSGDADSIVPVTSTRYSLASLKLPVVVPWFSWYNKQEVGGREIVYKGNLTLVTVRGAGHEVPLLRPQEFLQVFRNFLRGSLLPRDPYK